MKDLVIAGKKFNSRFFLGTGKFASKQQLAAALAASGTELVTTAPVPNRTTSSARSTGRRSKSC